MRGRRIKLSKLRFGFRLPQFNRGMGSIAENGNEVNSF